MILNAADIDGCFQRTVSALLPLLVQLWILPDSFDGTIGELEPVFTAAEVKNHIISPPLAGMGTLAAKKMMLPNSQGTGLGSAWRPNNWNLPPFPF